MTAAKSSKDGSGETTSRADSLASKARDRSGPVVVRPARKSRPLARAAIYRVGSGQEIASGEYGASAEIIDFDTATQAVNALGSGLTQAAGVFTFAAELEGHLIQVGAYARVTEGSVEVVDTPGFHQLSYEGTAGLRGEAVLNGVQEVGEVISGGGPGLSATPLVSDATAGVDFSSHTHGLPQHYHVVARHVEKRLVLPMELFAVPSGGCTVWLVWEFLAFGDFTGTDTSETLVISEAKICFVDLGFLAPDIA